MRQAGEVTYADAHKQRRNEGLVFQLIFLFKYLADNQLRFFFIIIELWNLLPILT